MKSEAVAMDRKCQKLKQDNARLREELQADAATVREETMGRIKSCAGKSVQSVSAYGAVVREIRALADGSEGDVERDKVERVMEGMKEEEYRELSICLCKQILLERSLCVPRLT